MTNRYHEQSMVTAKMLRDLGKIDAATYASFVEFAKKAGPDEIPVLGICDGKLAMGYQPVPKSNEMLPKLSPGQCIGLYQVGA